MFDIEYKGAGSIVIETKKTRLVTDPKLSLVGLKDLSVKDAIEVATEDRFVILSDDAKLVIEGPGEYEVSDFSIRGIASARHLDTEADEKKSTIYRLEIGDVRIGLLGNIMPTLSEEQLEELGVLDILVLPIGGNGYTLDATSAATLTRLIDPKVVVPVHYNDAALKYEVPQEDISVFVKELGAPVEKAAKYRIKTTAAIPSTLTIVEIERS